MNSIRTEIEDTISEIAECGEELQQMKSDRLIYLVDNINRRVHGNHWRLVCNRPSPLENTSPA
jgi:hypothetical protein